MSEERVKGLHRIDVRDKKGNLSKAILEIKYRRIRVLPPINKKRRYPELTLTVIHAQERGTPQGREKIDWKFYIQSVFSSELNLWVIESRTWPC